MTNKFITVSFYTEKYKELIPKWTAACDKFGLPYDCREMPDTGLWNRNVLMKPRVILDALDKTGMEVLWVDMDGEIVKYPVLIDELHLIGYDIAMRRFDMAVDHNRPSFRKLSNRNFWQNKVCSSATMWYANNDKCRAVLEREIELIDGDPDRWFGDEDALNAAMYDIGYALDMKCYDLPVEYCFINSHCALGNFPENEELLKDAVIVQDLFDRKVRNKWRYGIINV